MPENNKTEDFLLKLAPCIECGELEKCVEEAALVAREMGIGAKELLSLSSDEYGRRKYGSAYVFALAAALGFEGEEKAKAYYNAGLAMQYDEKLEKAEKLYKKTIEIDPKFSWAYSNYAKLLKKQGRMLEAEKQYLKAIEADPKFAWAHNDYAKLLEKLGRISEAEEQYLKATEADPKNARVHNNYASFSNTPAGPFITTVFALLISLENLTIVSIPISCMGNSVFRFRTFSSTRSSLLFNATSTGSPIFSPKRESNSLAISICGR